MTGRWRFISDHRDLYGVQRLCRVLAVSASGFYRWIAASAARAARRAADEDLAASIVEIHEMSNGAYGVPTQLRHHGHHLRQLRLLHRRWVVGTRHR